jgi:hypothetical protein
MKHVANEPCAAVVFSCNSNAAPAPLRVRETLHTSVPSRSSGRKAK